MYKNLRIIFTILSAICLAAVIPMGMLFDYPGLFGALIGAGIFFMLMLLCKQSQESAEKKAEQLAQTDADDADSTGSADSADDQAQAKMPPQKTVASAKNAPPKYKRKKK